MLTLLIRRCIILSTSVIFSSSWFVSKRFPSIQWVLIFNFISETNSQSGSVTEMLTQGRELWRSVLDSEEDVRFYWSIINNKWFWFILIHVYLHIPDHYYDYQYFAFLFNKIFETWSFSIDLLLLSTRTIHIINICTINKHLLHWSRLFILETSHDLFIYLFILQHAKRHKRNTKNQFTDENKHFKNKVEHVEKTLKSVNRTNRFV